MNIYEIVQHVIYLAILVMGIAILSVAAVKIDQWERANAYPYDKLCKLYDTCKH